MFASVCDSVRALTENNESIDDVINWVTLLSRIAGDIVVG